MSEKGRRTLGLTLDGKLILDPYPDTSAIIYGATGAAKTTSVVVPAIESLLSDTSLALKNVPPSMSLEKQG